ncbi:MAG: hypothetical protein IT223_07825 [Crocinitomicaceae bacterium]|nr:hypothetical protein [Crocinitomicaceae bacterium]
MISLALIIPTERTNNPFEVTMQSGQRQYETESEPVTRHLARAKRANPRIVYSSRQT